LNDISDVIVVCAKNDNVDEEQTSVHEAVEDVDNIDSSDELIEALLRQAEENLASKESLQQETIKSRIRYDLLFYFILSQS
jgi:hypothetical protein